MPLEIQPSAILKMKLGFPSGLNNMWLLLCSLIRAAQYILHLDMPAKNCSAPLQDGWVVPEGLDTHQGHFHTNIAATQTKPGTGQGRGE